MYFLLFNFDKHRILKVSSSNQLKVDISDAQFLGVFCDPINSIPVAWEKHSYWDTPASGNTSVGKWCVEPVGQWLSPLIVFNYFGVFTCLFRLWFLDSFLKLLLSFKGSLLSSFILKLLWCLLRFLWFCCSDERMSWMCLGDAKQGLKDWLIGRHQSTLDYWHIAFIILWAWEKWSKCMS